MIRIKIMSIGGPLAPFGFIAKRPSTKQNSRDRENDPGCLNRPNYPLPIYEVAKRCVTN